MLRSLKRLFKDRPSYDHWDSPEVWKEHPQTRFEKPRAPGKRPPHHPRIYL